MGALGAALDASCLDLLDARHRYGLVLGLLRVGLGGLVVLGPGRERLADAMACWHSAVTFCVGDGKAQRPQSLDHPAVDPYLLAVASWYLSGALGRADVGACLRHRSHARRVYPSDSVRLCRRQFDAVRLAGVDPETGRVVLANFARGSARAQQSFSDHGLRNRVRWHAVPAGAGSCVGREDFSWRSILQSDVR